MPTRDGQDRLAVQPDHRVPDGESSRLQLLVAFPPSRVDLDSRQTSKPQHYPGARKLIYCSRTVPEIEKALAELKRLMEYRAQYTADGQPEDILALGLTSRKNLCVHPDVSRERRGNVVDARCRDMTSAWACSKGREDPEGSGVELCDFHEELGTREPGQLIPRGVWTLEELKEMGKEEGICPYFAVRRMLPFVNVVVYSMHYILE